MLHEQIPVQLMEVNDKIVIFTGEEMEGSFLESVKDQFKRKGAKPLGIMWIPNEQQVTSANKQETIDALKMLIAKLEAM